MHINWVEVAGVATIFSPGVLIGAIAQHLLRRPQQRADIGTAYTEVGLKWVQQLLSAKAKLEKSNEKLDRTNRELSRELESTIPELRAARAAMEQCSKQLTETTAELADCKHVMRLLADALTQCIPVLEGVSGVDMGQIANAMVAARRALNGKQ